MRIRNRSIALVRQCQTVFHALQLHGETRDIDAVADGVALVGGVRLLQEIGDVIQDLLVAERQVLLQDRVLLVALRKIDQ